MTAALPPIAKGSVAPHFAALCAKIQAEARHTAAQPGPAAALNAAILALLACLVGAFAILFARLEAGEALAPAAPSRPGPSRPGPSRPALRIASGCPRLRRAIPARPARAASAAPAIAARDAAPCRAHAAAPAIPPGPAPRRPRSHPPPALREFAEIPPRRLTRKMLRYQNK